MLLQIAPYLGYLASLMLIFALLAKSDLKFRYFGMAGNIFFIAYALIVKAYPVLLTNVILLGINGYYCYKLLNLKEDFELMEFSGKEKLIQKFLFFYKTDIESYYPEFKKEELEDNLNFVVLRNLVIANIFSVKVDEEGKGEVLINYTVPKYRDFKIGTFIFEREKDFLKNNGVKYLHYSRVVNKNHKNFLKKMNFKNTPEGFVKNLQQPEEIIS